MTGRASGRAVGERGTISAFVVAIAFACLLAAGLVRDQGKGAIYVASDVLEHKPS